MTDRKVSLIALVIIAIIIVSGIYFFKDRQGTPTTGGYPKSQLLIDGEWILRHLSDLDVRIIDVRSGPEYNRGHIRNAVWLDFERLRITVNGVRNAATQENVEFIFGELGLTPESIVVIYDNGDSLDAGLVFWTLEYYGHKDVRVLNGGWSQWSIERRPESIEVPSLHSTVYKVTLRPEVLATVDYIIENLNSSKIIILDARSSFEFQGIDVRSKRGGHIPGSVNVEWKKALEPNGYFKPGPDLIKLYQQVGVTGDKEVVTLCQTGHRAAHSYFVMCLLGYKARMYDGSWEEWGNREDLPIE